MIKMYKRRAAGASQETPPNILQPAQSVGVVGWSGHVTKKAENRARVTYRRGSRVVWPCNQKGRKPRARHLQY